VKKGARESERFFVGSTQRVSPPQLPKATPHNIVAVIGTAMQRSASY
jgi:hypothetical protein